MHADPIVEIDALEPLQPRFLLDVRDAVSFDARHPQGAVRVPVAEWVAFAKAADTSFDNVAFWEARIAELGVGPDTHAVVYDDGRMTEAARVWFILQHFGATASILNGGWKALEARCEEVAGCAPSATPFRARPGAGRVGLTDRQRLKGQLDEVAVFDSRTRAEHVGKDLKNNKRGGRLPGARLLPHAELLDGGRLRATEALRGMIADAGFSPDERIVAHCDAGGRAALAAVAALRAGFDKVDVYYLSFSDWAQDDSCPLERPGD
jgi:thiosulfate/3-mercaptopyruvate sulfurtransferase